METKENSEIVMPSLLSENGPRAVSVEVIMDSSNAKNWHLFSVFDLLKLMFCQNTNFN